MIKIHRLILFFPLQMQVMSSAKQHRKYDSGYQKRRKKQRIDELIESQKGAMERFIRKEPQVSHPQNNQTLDQEQGTTQNTSVPDANEPNDGETHVENIVPIDEIEIENIEEVPNNGDYMDGTSIDVNLDSSSHDTNVDDTSFSPDIFDPRYWDSLDPRQVDILAKKGPKRDLSIKKGPKDRYSRRWSARSYIRILPNGEKCNRDWLVYSKELDRVFCFSCKLFTNGHRKGQLANDGFNDWTHLYERITEHETSSDHVLTMTTWYDLHNNLEKGKGIDKVAQRQLEKEKEHWRKLLRK